jgi:hypothetical protein
MAEMFLAFSEKLNFMEKATFKGLRQTKVKQIFTLQQDNKNYRFMRLPTSSFALPKNINNANLAVRPLGQSTLTEA